MRARAGVTVEEAEEVVLLVAGQPLEMQPDVTLGSQELKGL